MSPRSLLFSSDLETSRQITRALQELELGVEACSEIFAALRALTTKTLHVIVIDWDEGLEASFLLKTARESRSNHDVFAIVVGRTDARAALEQAGADVVLSKPLRSEEAQHVLLTSDSFTARLKSWAQQPHAAAVTTNRTPRIESPSRPVAVPGWPTPGKVASSTEASQEAPIHLSFSTFGDGLAGESVFKKLRRKGDAKILPFVPAGLHGLVLRSAAVGVIFFAVGYVLSQPLSDVSSAVASAGHATWQSVRGIGQRPTEGVQAAVTTSPEVTPDVPQWHGKSGKVKVVPVRNSQPERAQVTVEMPAPIAQRAALQEPVRVAEPSQAPIAVAHSVTIPDSLGAPFPGVTAARESGAKDNSGLMDALQPVTIPGQLSEKLLLEKIVPSYPEKALQAGLRGPVVLQAWIGKDGRIQELKLIRGPLLLGQAAFDAVRNWRYKPYLLNGEAVEAQTLVTVDFSLP